MSESTMTTSKLGDKFWKNSLDQLHRSVGPAVERSDGTKEWHQNGRLHRIDGPAIELIDGTKVWYKNGLRHRIDGPAVEWVNGSKEWLQNDQLHRIDGPAVEWVGGKVLWYIKGNFLGNNLKGFWKLWDLLNEEERQNVNLHMWLVRLQNV